MKKLLSFVCAILMLGSLTACGGNGSTSDPSSSSEPAAPSTTIQTPEEIPAPDITPDESVPSGETGRVLVAYFSATGNTEGVAEIIIDHLNADPYEIIPEVPYTAADLDYGDSSSRSSVEMDDPSARPAISGSVEGMADYDVIFLGYPIWWGEAPRIISTFLESYDLSGKTIVPFCTSASSGMGSSAKNIQNLTAGTNWLDGQRFSGNPSKNDVIDWVDGLNLAG